MTLLTDDSMTGQPTDRTRKQGGAGQGEELAGVWRLRRRLCAACQPLQLLHKRRL